MSQSTCPIGFTIYTCPSFPTDWSLFLSESPVFEGSGWCSTAIETTSRQGTFWVHSTTLTLWHSSRASTTSLRLIRTWPTVQPTVPGQTLPQSQTAQRCAALTTSNGAWTNASFSHPCAPRREVLLGTPAQGGGAWLTSFGGATMTCSTRSAPQRVTVISLQNGNGPFGHSRR
ncbi:hypothetical protein BJY52DRAFT_1231157 [Lactarius psammicola]|nr:hypothetical protein BJY52DRAFT_1231157 [Lactarius psammicola]